MPHAALLAVLLAASTLLPSAAEPPAPRAIRVAVLGDSFTKAVDRERPFDGWPEQLGRMLGERSEVVNCSRSGNRLGPGTRQFVLEMPEFRRAEDARADVVVLALGSADLAVAGGGDPESLRGGLIQVLEGMKVFRPEPKVFLCIPPATVSGTRAELYAQALSVNAPMFIEFAAVRGMGLIDLRPATEGIAPPDGGLPSASPEAATRIAATVFRAITGDEPPAGAGPYLDSFDPAAFDRRTLLPAGDATIAAKGWSVANGESAGRLVNKDDAAALLMEGAIPEGPFRMRWILRWSAGPSMSQRGGPQFGAGGNWLSLDNRNASLQVAGPDIRGRPELPASARVAPQDTTIEIELRRSQGVLEWRIDGKPVYATPITSKTLATAGLDPMGARVELESWTLDLPKP